jgi:hypothetical protein
MKRFAFLLSLLLAVTLPLSACVENNILAPQDNGKSAEVTFPPFAIGNNSIWMNTTFYQPPLTFYADAEWDQQVVVEVETLSYAEKPNVVVAYAILNPLIDVAPPKGMSAWALTISAQAVGYGAVKITTYPRSNPAGKTSYYLTVSDKG